MREVFPCLVCAGTELERMHPKVYTNITRQACISPTSILVSDKAVAGLLMAMSHQMLKTDINWGKIVALFAVAGGLAVDCIHQGHPEFLHGIMEGMTEILEVNLGEWIASNGGWVGCCRSHFCKNCVCFNVFRLHYVRNVDRKIKKFLSLSTHPWPS